MPSTFASQVIISLSMFEIFETNNFPSFRAKSYKALALQLCKRQLFLPVQLR